MIEECTACNLYLAACPKTAGRFLETRSLEDCASALAPLAVVTVQPHYAEVPINTF
jgi:hypothetical protein